MRRLLPVLSLLALACDGGKCPPAPAWASTQPGSRIPGREERHPVAYVAAPLEQRIRDRLGDAWLMDRRGQQLICTRGKPSPAGEDFVRQLHEEVRRLRASHRGLDAVYGRRQVTLGGRARDCDDLADAMLDLATVDGLDRIVIEVSCAERALAGSATHP